MVRNLFNSRHPNVRCLIQTTYMRECLALFETRSQSEILEMLESLDNETFDELLDELIRYRKNKQEDGIIDYED